LGGLLGRHDMMGKFANVAILTMMINQGERMYFTVSSCTALYLLAPSCVPFPYLQCSIFLYRSFIALLVT
jgi:hypothetical protein